MQKTTEMIKTINENASYYYTHEAIMRQLTALATQMLADVQADVQAEIAAAGAVAEPPAPAPAPEDQGGV